MDTDELLKLSPEDRKAALRAKYGKPATPTKTYGPELPPPPSAVTRGPGAAPTPPPVVREVNLPTRGMNQTDLDQAALRAASAERSAALQQGQSVEKADERALRAREGAYTVGPGADMLGADTVARAIYGGRPVPNVVRVYGPRVEAMPMVEPTKAERDAAHRATVLKMDPIKMIMGEDAAPVDLPNEQDKKWARTAMANAGLSIAGGFFGGAVPLWELGSRVAGAMGADVSGVQLFPEAALSPGAAAEAVYDYGADRDVQRLARVALPPLAAMSELPDAMVGQPTRNPYKDAAETATGVASRFGLGDARGAVREATGIDEGETALFWDDVRPRADFDAAATEYLNGSRAAVDALPLRALPARLRTEAVDVDKWIEMAKIDPELATIAEVADLDLAVIETAVESLPIGLVMRYQPELRPPDSDLRKTIELRHERKRWRGNESFDAIGNIMAGGLVKPVKNGNDVLFVPSAWQHALRAAGAPWAATVVEADLHPYDMVFIPGVSRPDATAQDDQSWYAKWANLRLPSVYGVESAVRSGAFNDWLDVVGLNGGTRYADLASPESTWWGRTMADIAMPEYANRGYQDVFLRAGGDPNGVAADVLGAADVVMQFLLPVEEAVAAPFGAAMRGVNRGRMARRVGRELGVTSPGPAVAAMVPVLSGESDALNGFGHALNEEARDLLETGAMDPAKFTPQSRDDIRSVLRAARVENPDETADLILGWLADRRARVRDTSSEVATLGGPETQKMRDSNAYKDRERDLEDMARDPANGLRPADIPIIMRELEVQALNAVDAGEVPSTEAYFQRHSWTTGIDDGADLPEAAPIFDDAAIAAMAPTDPAPRAEWQAGVDAARAAFAAKVKAGTDATTAMREVRAEAEAAFEARRVAAKAKDPASSMAREDDLALRGAVDAMSKPLVPKKAPLKSESPGTVHGSIERVGEVPDHRVDRIAAMAPVDPASRAEWQAGVDAARAAFSAKVRAGADPIAALREVRAEAEAASDARRAAAKAKDPASSVAREDDFTLRGALDAMSKGKKTEEPNVSVISGSGPDDAATRAGDARVEEYREATRARMAMAVRNEARLEGVSSARDALDALIAGGDLTADELAVAKRIRGSILPEIRLVLMSPTDADLPNVPAGALGYFGPPWKGDPNGTVYLRRVANRDHGMDPDTILHEMLHAATSSRLRVGSLPKHEGTHLARAVADLQELRTHVLREVDARNVYINPHGLSNVGEFISAGLTEPMFQEVLRALPSPTTKGTLWSDFVSYIRRLLGIPKAEESALSALMARTDRLLDAPFDTTRPTNPSILRSAEGGVTRGSISPEATNPADVSRWLIKLFRTGDVRTALHEGAHLMTLMRPKFEAEAARIFDSVDGKLTTKGHEQLADAVTRLLRGRYRPGSRVDNIAQDVLDALGDVWSRVRTLPIVDAVPDRLRAKLDTLPDAIPAEFRVMWDRELHPKAAADGVAVRLTDERQPRRFPFAVNASADAAENIAEQKAARAGKARAYGSIERDPTQVQAALGITPGMKDVDPVDLMANVIAYIGVERLRREWGAVGELKTLPSNKTAVPAERHASVLKRAKSRRDGYFMGAEPAPIQGTNDLALDANAQAGLRRLIREVEVSPLGGNVPEAFRDPNADLSRVSMDDYNRLVAEQIDLYAGYGAWREKNAALAAVPGVVRLLNNVEAWGDRGTARVVLDKVREAFVVNTLPDQMLQPFQRDVITAFERTVPEAIAEVQRALLDQARKNKKGDLSFTSADLVVGLAKSMGPEVVPTDTLDVLRAAEVVLNEPDLNMLVGNASVLDELFARAPLGEGAATQMRNEVDALGFLDYVVRNAETDGTTPADWLIANRANLPEHLQAATPDDANLILADQMSVVLDGVQRRSLAVDNTGHEIALMFAGSDDETLAKKIPNDGVRRRLFRDVYEQWYSGDHTAIFDTLTDAGYVVSGPDYDQGAAVLGTILRLNIRRKVATLAARLAEAGLTGDVANLTQAGFKYDRPFSAVAVRSPRDRFRSDVVDFITAQLGWQTQAVRRDGAYKAPLGDITSMGTSAFSPEGKAAYAEAMAQIAKWGFTPGSNVVKWNQVDLGGGQRVILPDIFESAITDLVNEGAPTFMARPGAKMDARVGPVTEGAAWARTIDQEAVSVAAQLLVKTYGYSVGMLHKGMLTGLGPAIRAGYYVGNAFGGVLQLYQRMGVIGATRVLAGSAADGGMVANVMRRLYDSGAYVDEPARTGRLLPDGRYITDQMLARDAAKYGLNTSQAKTEWSTTLINEIRAEEPSTWNRVVKAGLADVPGARTAARAADVALDFPRRWRRWLDEGATAIDNYYRVSTYLDGLKRGLAADEAAQVARDVAFDWNALTKFEKNVARKIILFYSFQRRNQDLFWWTFLHHPSRITGQLRLMYGMQEANLGEDSELYVSPFNEGRIILDARPPFKDNHVALAQQGAMTMTPSTNVNAAMGLWLDLMGVATFDPVAGESLMNRLNPFIAAPLALTVGYDVRRNRKIEDTSMAVPPGVADLDYAISSRIVDLDNAMNGGLLMQALDARPVPPRDDATLDYPGQIRFEVNRENPGAVRLFWGMMNLLPVASVERNVATMSRATGAGGYEPKAGTDAVEEAGRWLGVPTESIPTRAKVVGDLRERATADTEALEREAEKGSVTSGRGR